MTRPDPIPGLVVRYDYLWDRDARRGRTDGSKDRPCVIVLARSVNETGQITVVLAPVTHSAPSPHDGIEVPADVKRILGMDAARSWVILNEVNAVPWGNAGFVPVAPGRWAYGTLPASLTRSLVENILAQIRAGKAPVNRRRD